MIELRNVGKSFGKKVVFSDVNLEIDDGEFVVLRGESGAGKTTLLNIIGGIEPVSSGRVLINGAESTKKRSVGFVFQGFYLQNQLNIRDNIELPGMFAGIPRKERRPRAELLAKLLDIEDVLDNFPEHVSGGQAERACVARSLFLNPEIILADEPTNNLDEKNVAKAMELLAYFWKQYGRTVIVATHDERAAKYATKVVEVANGSVRVL